MKQLALLTVGLGAFLFGCATGEGDIVGSGGSTTSSNGGSGEGGDPVHTSDGGSTNVTQSNMETVTNSVTTTSTMTTSTNTVTTTQAGCVGNQFDCGNGQCLAATQECDSTVQCANGADEAPINGNCSTTTTGSASTSSGGGCGVFEIPCLDGNGCVPIFYLCDGGPPDCADGSDEEGCGTAPPEWMCDASYYDAADGCDCGCGAVDPDCADATVGSCTYCAEAGSCSATDCPGDIDPANNGSCI